MEIIFETERLILRRLTLDDAPNFFALDSDPEVHKYLGATPVKKIEESEQMLQAVLDQYDNYGIGRLAVIDKSTKEFMGWSGIKYETTVRDYDYYDLGYRFIKKYWGKGIATESSVGSLKYGFEDLKLTEIFAGAHIDNYGSNNVLKKVGLRYIEKFDFEEMPHNWYGITKEEWLTNNNSE